MRVEKIDLFSINKNVKFNGNCRVVTDAAGKLKYRSTTSFFRGDLNWEQFAQLLKQKYAKET